MSNNRQNHGEGRFDKIIRDVYNVKFENSLTLGHPRIYLLLLLRTYSNGQEIMGFWQSKLHVQKAVRQLIQKYVKEIQMVSHSDVRVRSTIFERRI